MTPMPQKDEVVDRYHRAAQREVSHEKARWGSLQSMQSRFDAAATLLEFSGVERWLDVGAGAGAFQRRVLAVHEVPIVVALDLVPTLLGEIDPAPGLSRIHCAAGDAGSIPLRDRSFDLVTLVGVLHCSGVEPRTVLTEASRCLGEGGELLLTTMSRDWVGFEEAGNEPNPDHAWFTIEQVQRYCLEAGLDVEQVHGLLPREGTLTDPRDGYCLVLRARRNDP